MTKQEFKKYEGKTTFGFVRGVNIDGCIVIGYDSLRNGSLIVGCHGSRGWICFLTTDVVDENLKRQFESFLYVNVENVKIEKDLDLTSILKGCEGVELWSDICGICKLKKIHYDYSRPIVIKSKYSKHLFLMKDGKYYTEGKCMLWPSETNRDWSTFKKPVKVNDDDWVVCWFEGAGFEILRYAEIKVLDYEYDYVVRFEQFNPNLSKEELKKLSIV